MDKKIKISVIVPCYNTEKFIEKCLNSILNQTLKEIEIIIINDGSTDNSLLKTKNYEDDSRVKIIDKENEGLTKTRNLGLNLASGKYVYFVDSDDYLESNDVLEKLYNTADKNDLDILIFDYFRDYKNRKEYFISSRKYSELKIDKNEYFEDILFEKYWGSTWNKIVRLSIYKENNIKFPENIFLKEDYVTSLKLIYFSKKIGKLDEALYNYVMHSQQGTKTIDRNKFYLDCYKGYIDLISFFKDDKKILEMLEKQKWELYYQILKSKNKRYSVYSRVKKEIKKEKNIVYKDWNVIKKIKFILRTFF